MNITDPNGIYLKNNFFSASSSAFIIIMENGASKHRRNKLLRKYKVARIEMWEELKKKSNSLQPFVW